MAGSEEGLPERKDTDQRQSRAASCFPSRGGSSVWFLMASKLPPQALELPGTTSRCWLVAVGAMCQAGRWCCRAGAPGAEPGWMDCSDEGHGEGTE